MHSLCPLHSLSEFPTDGQVPGMIPKVAIFVKSNFAAVLAQFAKAIVVCAGFLHKARASGREERLYESFRAVNNG